MMLYLSTFYLSEATMEVVVVVARDTRRAKAAVEIMVVPQPPPSVLIE